MWQQSGWLRALHPMQSGSSCKHTGVVPHGHWCWFLCGPWLLGWKLSDDGQWCFFSALLLGMIVDFFWKSEMLNIPVHTSVSTVPNTESFLEYCLGLKLSGALMYCSVLFIFGEAGGYGFEVYIPFLSNHWWKNYPVVSFVVLLTTLTANVCLHLKAANLQRLCTSPIN